MSNCEILLEIRNKPELKNIQPLEIRKKIMLMFLNILNSFYNYFKKKNKIKEYEILKEKLYTFIISKLLILIEKNIVENFLNKEKEFYEKYNYLIFYLDDDLHIIYMNILLLFFIYNIFKNENYTDFKLDKYIKIENEIESKLKNNNIGFFTKNEKGIKSNKILFKVIFKYNNMIYDLHKFTEDINSNNDIFINLISNIDNMTLI